MWWLVGLGIVSICVVVWWVIHYVGWRDFAPGRHLLGHVDEIPPDHTEEENGAITEVLAAVEDDSYRRHYDPSFYRLSAAVRVARARGARRRLR
ncbi:hypothetical protein [Nocardia sp. NPDC057227]|uniref:hypothetical protein n=1 Tax=Nocardia sp. NPDC057227 TaxID=3346056 RepID=UPI0036390B07